MSEPGLPESLAVSFGVAAGEIGMRSAARIFIEELARTGGADRVDAARDVLGRQFVVFDALASSWLEHGALPTLDAAPVLAELRSAQRVLIVGTEADALDRIIPALGVRVGLVPGGGGLADDPVRAAANYGDAVEVVHLENWSRWAGAKSALLTFVYGCDEDLANVAPNYLRLVGPDVNAAFRMLIGWNVLGARPRLHPRYFVETGVHSFSSLISGRAHA